MKYKLKPIPANTVVHTPTEADAKELLAILHENGYKWYGGEELIGRPNWHRHEEDTCYCMKSSIVVYARKQFYISEDYDILTLAEFKRLYCVEQPQPKFNKGDKAVVVTNAYGLKKAVGGVCEITEVMPHGYHIMSLTGKWFAKESDLEPYTEPETKDEAIETKDEAIETKDEAIETKDEAIETKDEAIETKELNLCELLQGYEGETFYSLVAGNCRLKEINEGAGFPICIILDACTTWEYLTKDGKRFNVSDARCMLYPSRALYEQYPLDPLKAWSVWQKEQKKWKLRIGYSREDSIPVGDIIDLFFRTSTDREQAIEEIKAIIEKFSLL